MTSLSRFTPAASRTIVQASLHAADDGFAVLAPEFLLLALADVRPLAGRPQGIGITRAVVRREIAGKPAMTRSNRDRELLAALGIDADDIRRRAARATGVRPDDPALWTLHRSRLRPLRLTLRGPATNAALSGASRKVIEVATWACRRGHRTKPDSEDLLWGLLADGSSPAVHILRRLDVNLKALWTDLQRWHTAAGPNA
ncbi:MAG: hypothetical protein LBV34_16380 [Nocardiopsaceae bacterium]|jgi:hypothetical protein|nr:hypothetical protein [Nocardiopsaceae bacterium]